MSTSFNCENKLRELATEFYSKANELEKAADVLRDLRDGENIQNRLNVAKEWAKWWMK